MNETLYHIGLDIGSTTIKVLILDEDKDVVYAKYRRHFSDVRVTLETALTEALDDECFKNAAFTLTCTGSGAISVAQDYDIPFVQEVIASATSVRNLIPDVDVTIELGGEDAKITFFTGGLEQRMNETCAGGTGAFIDQMASFLNTDAPGLNSLAAEHTTLYPIASRCGVFAKSDILPLLNEGCAKTDIAASIFQAVVDQTIGGLACGREIKGKVAFLGGPLAFLPELRNRFIETLKLDSEHDVIPDRAEFFVAYGAALNAFEERARMRRDSSGMRREENDLSLMALTDLIARIRSGSDKRRTATLRPLFRSLDELEDFRARHSVHVAKRADISSLAGEQPAAVFLGIDIGSTTIKSVLLSERCEVLRTTYQSSSGDPMNAALAILKDTYSALPPNVRIGGSGVTGYGSALVRAAFRADVDEVETLAHSKAARYFFPGISFILDIGGQDIKCLHVTNGVVDRIQLNEACSSGCGSFIETFAKSLGMDLETFVDEALHAQAPVDLGTRCTVFMNSKVKQAQKEGAKVGDIAAGLSYSVIKNALYKVIKISSPDELGSLIMAQGGSFKNDALLRALELSVGKEVVRMDISGLMGAFGAALLAREHMGSGGVSGLMSREELENFTMSSKTARCGRCSNHCLLTVSRFNDGSRFISGNRCERGAGSSSVMKYPELPNMMDYKYKRLFDHYTPLGEDAPRGDIGLPRALNMYENYPLWFTLFTKLGFRVVLSAESSKKTFNAGLSTIPSQTVCYPAKLAHGHIRWLIDHGVTRIFYPCLPKEQKDFESQDNHFNCPVVGGYPELLRNNMDILRSEGIRYYCPFLALEEKSMFKVLRGLDLFSSVEDEALMKAIHAGFEEQAAYKRDIREAGEKALAYIKENNKYAVILAGHPYHVDPEVNHGIPELINSTGLAVLTEDSVAHLMPDPGPLRVVDQWTYHGRLYRAAAFSAPYDNIALIQLVSFGCGLDAVTSDQVEELLERSKRLYTQIKIDEGSNLGATRIRVRSLLATMRERQGYYGSEDLSAGNDAFAHEPAKHGSEAQRLARQDMTTRGIRILESMPKPPSFTEEMRETHTILIPQMAPLHFQFFPTMMKACGYKCELLERVSREDIEAGLSHVNNDVCYPAITVVGQLMNAINSGRYDKDRIAIILSQTGGGCRATNYIGFMRKALNDCGLSHIPVISFNMKGLEQNPGFKINWDLLKRGFICLFYGDVLMRVTNRTRPYEKTEGSADELAAEWAEAVKPNVANGSFSECYGNIREIIRSFDRLPLRNISRKPRVGLVGEILLKFHPDANNQAVRVIESEDGEAVMPDLLDFFLYSSYDPIYGAIKMGESKKKAISSAAILSLLLFLRRPIVKALKKSGRYGTPLPFGDLRQQSKGIVSLGHQTGEGWLLTAEMVELLHQNVPNILCMQPFGCLPNHITGKGVLKELKRQYPDANISAVDYDPSASEVNQINRIKLMMSVARQTAGLNG